MEKKKYELCLEVLRRMDREEILDHLIIVGSWCILLYQDYFKGEGNLPPIRTRDIEFLIPIPPKFDRKTDLYAIIKDLGFITEFKGNQGYLIFQHPELILEFLVPERGRGRSKPYPVTQLGINAQALRFMDLLAQDTIRTSFENIEVTIPHPANFSLQKLIIAKRRKDQGKSVKDRLQAVAVLKAIRETGKFESVIKLHRSIPKKWQQIVRQELIDLEEHEILELLEKKE